MRVVPIPLRNAFDHVNYLLVCDVAGEAIAVDPYDVDRVRGAAEAQGVSITGIVNTHEHWDHAGKNAEMKALTGATVMAPRVAAGTLEGLDRLLVDGNAIAVGQSGSLTVRAVPGHTMASIALLGEAALEPFIIAGDTMFGAGVGNCGYGGHAPTLYESITALSAFPDATRLYPGHDYLKRNLGFTLSVEPANAAARALAETLGEGDAPYFTTLGEERTINSFLRLDSPEIRRSLDLPLATAARDVFLALRSRRDSW